MKRIHILMASGAAATLAVLGGVIVAINYSPNTNIQTGSTLGQSDEQIIEETRRQQDELAVQPDINNEEFIITGSNVSCASTGVNNNFEQSCSGNIRIVPKANDSMNPGLYKIDEQTKLMHGGQEQDLNSLAQLARNQAVIRLLLVPGSESMLAEISY